ncbi:MULTISPECIES: Imm50 family immunity protein [unclassified Brenneria]|uniref:Imm50 family immunity protein n=1 Tax=unclassified Brenneria TaxID=2634434 RepID=UPI0029C19529|nr:MULTISPECIES: Imm50 family immunity protein [unclassified Brenneria]MDX5631098.1 Imm50 family immunity protein [Brenneria sp. L3-3Z]MDX5698171.1 Imm50 family immunity protein [Brenneria sp. L4-2C]
MWFDYAHGKEKINFMFDNELPLENSEFCSFTYHDISKLSLRFNTRFIPKKLPNKWTENEFNSISVLLTFTEVLSLKVNLKNINFICTPDVKLIDNSIMLSIENKESSFRCLANFMFIDEIKPHLDQRWK